MSSALAAQWQQLQAMLTKFETTRDAVRNNFAFAFVDGALVRAVRDGSWLLLDELNLVSIRLSSVSPFVAPHCQFVGAARHARSTVAVARRRRLVDERERVLVL